MKKTLAIAIFLSAVMLLTSCNIIVTKPDTTADSTADGSDTEQQIPEETYPHSDMVLAPLDEIVATTEHQSIPVSTFKYFFMDNYNSFINNYYYFLSYYGLDLTIPLHDQKYAEDETMTWYDFFLEDGKKAFEQYAKFAEMALKEGMSLNDDDDKEIESYLDSIDAAAKNSSMTFDEYMEEYMGEGMDRARIKKAIELSQLGYKYYLKLYNEKEYGEDQIEKEYADGAGKYSLTDYYYAYIEALYDETDGEEEVAAAKAAAKEKAEKLKELVESGTNFNDAYDTVMGVENNEGEETSDETSSKKTDLLRTRVSYTENDETAFLYAEGTTIGQVEITYDENGNAVVVQCAALPYKNTLRTVNVRHILLNSTDYSSEEKALEKAEELLKAIDEATDKKEKFISLVAEFSNDPGSSSKGGLYEDVMPGDMVTEFNDWCFDPERKAGDTGIVLTDYGYHIMYLDGFGEELWRADCEKALRDADFSKKAEEIYGTVKVTYKDDLLDKITK